MSINDLAALAPLLMLAGSCALVMLQIALWREHNLTISLTLAGLAGTLALLPEAAQRPPVGVTDLLVIDGFSLFFLALIIATALAVVLLGVGYLKCQEGHCEEYYLLLLLATLGACILSCSRHFASFFLGLEILSIALFALIAYFRRRPASVEAGLKYLVLAASSSAFLLFGMALVYAYTGSLDFAGIAAQRFAMLEPHRSPILLAGMGMVVIGVAFKLALVPFHMWTADVYQGAPAPVTAFVATVSKSAMVALLVRLFAPLLPGAPALFWVLAWIAFASMIAGNLLALGQDHVKRILAYSSIAHLGYLLTAFLPGGSSGVGAAMYYIVAYTVSSLGAFGVVTLLSQREADRDRLADFRGLFFSHPWIAGAFTASLLSLAGIPLTTGFIGKFFAVATSAQARLWWLVITLVLTSAASLFYYLRIVVVMFSRASEEEAAAATADSIALPGILVLATVTALLFWLGVTPEAFLLLIRTVTG